MPLGRISCEGVGNGHFLTIVINFGFRAFWADFTLFASIFLGGNSREKGGNTREKGGNIRADSL